MKMLTVNKNDSGKRLDSFIRKSVPLLPQSLMYKYIRNKRIKLNGKRCSWDTRLCENDVVELYINDEFFDSSGDHDFLKSAEDVNVIYEDKNILLLNKPAGLLSHPDKNEYNDTAITRIMRYLYEKGEYNPKEENSFSPALVNRIDRNTTGIIIAAKNADALRILNEKIKNRELRRLYLCVCIGKFSNQSGVFTGFLKKDKRNNVVSITKNKTEGFKEIATAYSVLCFHNGLSLVEVELLTGRPHQIRAQFASERHPLMGDIKYGNSTHNTMYSNYEKQFLCSYKLIFDFKSDDGALNYLNGKVFEIEDVWFRDKFMAL